MCLNHKIVCPNIFTVLNRVATTTFTLTGVDVTVRGISTSRERRSSDVAAESRWFEIFRDSEKVRSERSVDARTKCVEKALRKFSISALKTKHPTEFVSKTNAIKPFFTLRTLKNKK